MLKINTARRSLVKGISLQCVAFLAGRHTLQNKQKREREHLFFFYSHCVSCAVQSLFSACWHTRILAGLSSICPLSRCILVYISISRSRASASSGLAREIAACRRHVRTLDTVVCSDSRAVNLAMPSIRSYSLNSLVNFPFIVLIECASELLRFECQSTVEFEWHVNDLW